MSVVLSRDDFRFIYERVPIVCVDLIVVDAARRILLVQRKNQPAAGQWWFPGGRVLIREPRIDAAHRKLQEEVGLEAVQPIREFRSYDLIFPDSFDAPTHAVTTAFLCRVDSCRLVKLDDQSQQFALRSTDAWLRLELHFFVRNVLEQIHSRL